MALKSSNKIDTNTYEIEVTVDGETFKKACTSAYLKGRKNIQVPGFRKGKATQGMIEKLYGEGVFYEEALDEVYPAAVSAAFDEAGLEVVDAPFDLEIPVMDKENGVEMKMKVTTYPEVKLGDYKGLKVAKLPTEATDEDVDNELKALQERNSRLIVADDRAAQNGDTVSLDFEGFVDGVAFEGGKGEDFQLKLGSGQFIPGFEEQVAGHKIDEDFDVTVTFPEDYQMTDYAGKEAVFKCKIHSISKEEIPELTDDFVKEISDFDTVDEWKADAKKKLEENAEQTAKVGFENALVAKLIDKVQDPIPHCMFEQRADGMMDAFANQLKGQNVDLDLYLQYTGMTKDQLKETYLERAENEVKLRLALEKIAELEGLEVADEELDAELTKLAEQYNMTLDDVKARIPVAEYKLDMLVTKALDLVKDSAVVDNSEPAEAEAEKAEEAPAEDKDAE